MTAILLALSLALAPCTADGHNQHRSSAEKRLFQKLHPCPSTGRTRGACPGYVIDHVCPLACCGADKATNMRWQTKADSRAKDRWELDCKRSCRSRRTKK